MKAIVLDERCRDSSPRARPLLQALLGQLVLAQLGPDEVQSYLWTLDTSALPAPVRGEALLAIADAALGGLPGVRYHPPRYAGRTKACAGDILQVRWDLPTKPQGDNPFLIDRSSSGPAEETTAVDGRARD